MSDNLFVTDYRLQHYLQGQGYLPGKAGGAGGATAYTDLTDAESVDLPTLNTPLFNQLSTINEVLDTFTSGKQDKLTAGANITITSDNIISAAGGGGGGGGNVTSVKTYGAVGNGTTDDTAAFQTAINATTGILWIPAGKYKLTNSLTVKSNLTILGDGTRGPDPTSTTGTILLSYINNPTITTDRPLFSYVGDTGPVYITNFHMSGVTIDGTNQGFINVADPSPMSSKGKGVYCTYMRACSFRDMEVLNFPATGLGIDYLEDVDISNVVANGNGRGTYGGNTQPLVGHAGIGIGTLTYVPVGGANPYHVESYSIHDCHCENNGTYGIFCESQSTTNWPAIGNRIYSNVCKGNAKGIGLAGPTYVSVFGNTCILNTVANISVDLGTYAPGTASYYAIIANNIIQGSTDFATYPTGNAGIYLDWSRLNGNGQAAAGQLIVANNLIHNCTRGIDGVTNLTNNISMVSIKGNEIDGALMEPIRFSYPTGSITAGIKLYELDISGNLIRNAGRSTNLTSMIQINVNASQVNIRNNTLVDEHAYALVSAIELQTSRTFSYVTISHNTLGPFTTVPTHVINGPNPLLNSFIGYNVGVDDTGASTGPKFQSAVLPLDYPGTGGGGGATTYAALTDKASVSLPTINTPLATALAGKQATLTAGTNITISSNVISASGSGGPALPGDDNLTLFRTALTNALTTRVVIAVMGDSITFGLYASCLNLAKPTVSNYAGILSKKLQAKYGDGGSGFAPNIVNTFPGSTLPYASGDDAHVVQTGTWTPNKVAINGGIGNFQSLGAASATSIFLVRGTMIYIYYRNGVAGTLTVLIDGVAAASISADTSVNVALEAVYGPYAAGTHTVKVVSDGLVPLCGVAGYNDVGVVVNCIGVPGQSISGFSPTTSAGGPNSWSVSYYGLSTNNGAPFTPSLKADCLVLEYGLNDANGMAGVYGPQGTDSSLFDVSSNAVAACQFFRDYVGKVQPIIFAQAASGKYDGTAVLRNANYAEINRTFKSIANIYNGSYIDMTTTYSSYLVDKANGYYFNNSAGKAQGTNSNSTDTAENVHMGDLGHAAMGLKIAQLIDPTIT